MEMEITKHTTTTVQLKQELVSITNKYNLSETTCDKYAQYCSVLLLITNCRVGYETKWKSYKHKQNNHVWSCSTLLVPVFFIIYFFFFFVQKLVQHRLHLHQPLMVHQDYLHPHHPLLLSKSCLES